MRTLSATHTANQKRLERPPLLKLVLTKDQQATQTYNIEASTNRIIAATHIEQEWSQLANVAVGSDSTLAALSLEGYAAVISYGYHDAAQGDEYSAAAPLEVVAQKTDTLLAREQSMLVTWFSLAGVFDLMQADKASASYTQASDDSNTVKALLTAIANATLACFNHCKNYTITYDSEDSLIDAYVPADYFSVAFNESRLSAFKKLIATTKCKARIEDDGEIHVFYPRISGTTWVKDTAYVMGDFIQPTTPNDYTYECTSAGTSGGSEPAWGTTPGGTTNDNTAVWTCRDYNYEYNDAIAAANHNFFEKSTRKRLVIPTKVTVTDPNNTYTGTATDSASETALGRSLPSYKQVRATDDAQCASIATAILQHAQVGAEKGHGSVPMNCGQEVMDYIKITDSVASDSRVGNVGYIRRDYTPGREFKCGIRFGRLTQELPFMRAISGDGRGGPSWEDFYALLDYIDQKDELITQYIIEGDWGTLNFDHIIDGETYAKVLGAHLSAGRLSISSVTVFDTEYDPSDKRRCFNVEPTTPYVVGDLWLDGSVLKRCTTARATGAYNAADWTAITLDELVDGSSYAKVLASHLDSGGLSISSSTTFAADYNPTEKFDMGDDTLDDVPDGSTYQLVKATQITAGEITLSSTGFAVNQGRVVAGTASGTSTRLAAEGLIGASLVGTSISAFADAGGGEVTVTTAAVHGLATGDRVLIIGTTNYNGAFTVTVVDTTNFKITDTWVSDDGTGYALQIQVEIKSTDGKIYAGGGSVIIDTDGIKVRDQYIDFQADDGGGYETYGYIFGYHTATLDQFRLIAVNHAAVVVDLYLQAGIGGDIIFGDDFDPEIDLTYDIGSGAKQVKRIYVGDILASGTVNITSTLTLAGVLDLGTDLRDLGILHAEPGEAEDTEYQNTSSFPLVVCITAALNDGEAYDLYIGAASPPTTLVGSLENDSGGNVKMMGTMIVPIDWYYKLVTTAGNPAVSDWHQYSIGDKA